MTSPAAVMSERFWNLKRSRIKVGACHSTRASSIGHECDRFLYYERTSNHLRALHDESTQAIFDLGSHLEKFVIREMEDMGIEVVEAQRPFQDPRYEITGHIDCKVLVPGLPRPIPCEIKGLNPYTADSIQTEADIRNNRSAWVRKYAGQLQTYELLDNIEAGVYALLNKVSGQIRFVDSALDLAFAESLLQKAERVKKAVATQTPPERNTEADCDRCPFAHLCCPDLAFGEAPEVVSDPELESMLKRREELKAAADAYAELDKEIKAKVGERPLSLCGDYSIAGKWIERKSYTVAAGRYWQARISRVVKAQNGEHHAA